MFGLQTTEKDWKSRSKNGQQMSGGLHCDLRFRLDAKPRQKCLASLKSSHHRNHFKHSTAKLLVTVNLYVTELTTQLFSGSALGD